MPRRYVVPVLTACTFAVCSIWYGPTGPPAKAGPPRHAEEETATGWTDWRGRRQRDAICPHVPETLPERVEFLWRHPLVSEGMGGVAAMDRYVIASDQDERGERDIWRCLDADTGRPLWTLRYPAAGNMPRDSGPRAIPVICGNLVYLLGALGHLHCVELPSGKVLWKTGYRDLGGEVPLWGFSATPLIVNDLLIVSPGAEDAAVVALDRLTGKVIWRCPGEPASYSSLVLVTLGGRRQVVGLDAYTMGGWDVKTGRRLWTVDPPGIDHFVVTPIVVGDKVLFADSVNGLRMYGFDRRGKMRSEPIAVCEDLRPDASTPVVLDGLLFGTSNCELFCLDVEDGLKELWRAEHKSLEAYASLIAGNSRVLMLTYGGELLLIEADRRRFKLVSRLKVLDKEHLGLYAHPALVQGRLYIRGPDALYCLSLDGT